MRDAGQTQEAVALDLMRLILTSSKDKSKKNILETYRDCLHVVKGGRVHDSSLKAEFPEYAEPPRHADLPFKKVKIAAIKKSTKKPPVVKKQRIKGK